MSDVMSTMKAVVTLDASGVQGGALQAQEAIVGFVNIAQQSFYGLNQAGQGLKKLGEDLLGFATQAVGAAVTFQSQAAELTMRTYDLSKSQTENKAAGEAQTAQIRQLADTLGQPIDKFAALATQMASFGYRGKDIETVTTSVQQLATVTGASATQIAIPFNRMVDLFGLSAAQSKNLASAVAEVSNRTTGGASALLLMTDRATSLAQAIGIRSPAAVLALTSTLADLDGRVRGMGTTFGIFTSDMVKAIDTGKNLAQIASVADMSGPVFKKAYETDALGAIGSFLTGLEKAREEGRNTIQMLQETGIKSTIAATGILELAQAYGRNAAEGKSNTEILQAANAAFQNAGQLADKYSIYQDSAAAKTATFHNKVKELQAAFGQGLLPALTTVLTTLSSVANFFQSALPGGAQTAIVIVAALVGGLLIFVGTLVTVGIRVAQFVQALQRMYAAHVKASQGASEATVTVTKSGQAAAVSGEEAAAAATEWEMFANAVRMGGMSSMAAAPEIEAAGTAAATTGGAMGGIAAIAGPVGIAVAALTTAFVLHGSAMQGATKSINEWKAAEDKAVGSGTLAQLGQQAADAEAKLAKLKERQDTLHSGFSWSTLGETIKDPLGALTENTATDKKADLLKGVIADIRKTIEQAGQVAQRFGWTFQEALDNAAKAGVDLKGNIQDIFKTLDKATAPGGMLSVGAAMTDTTAKIDAATKALVDLSKEQIRQAEDALRVSDAQIAYANSLQAVRDNALKVKEAILAISEAQVKQKDAVIAEMEAQWSADHAAQDQARALLQAEQALQDAHKKVADNTIAITKAQEELEKLNGPEYWITYQQAINAVADAQIRLHDESVKVGDAQWNLNYLLQEGASQRDIQNARDKLKDANQKVTDTTTNLAAAQQKLNEMPSDHADQVAAAQQRLVDSQTTLGRSTGDLAAKEEALNKQQFISANNIDVRKAQDALTSAKFGVERATNAISAAERTLAKLQDGSVQRASQAAHIALTNALWQEATANAKAIEDMHTAAGAADNEQQKAGILADQLIAVGRAGNDPVLIAAGQNILNGLKVPLDSTIQSSNTLQASLANMFAGKSFISGMLGLGPANGANMNFMGPVGGRPVAMPHGQQGGLVTKDEAWMLHAPEVIIPLNDPRAAMGWLENSGLLSQLGLSASKPKSSAGSSAIAASTVNNTSRGGDTLQLTAITTANPVEIMDQFVWNQRVSPR